MLKTLLTKLKVVFFFRLYVPNGKYQFDQLAAILRLLENYLQNVEGVSVAIDSKKTKNGVIYIFRDPQRAIVQDNFQDAYGRFENFMDLVQNSPRKAEAILVRKGVGPLDASGIISKYAKECMRIRLDAQHEEERRMLDLKYQLRNQLLELSDSSYKSVVAARQLPNMFSFAGNSGPITLNISNISAEENAIVEAVLQQQLEGGITCTHEDKQLIELFNKYTDTLAAAAQLKSYLDQIKDQALPADERKTAKQRIIGFLYKTARVAGDVGVKVLTTYLEKLLTSGTGTS